MKLLFGLHWPFKCWPRTRALPNLISYSHGAALIAWGCWLVVLAEPAIDLPDPWHPAVRPSHCLAALMPLWAWGAVSIMIGAWRIGSAWPVSKLRWASMVEAVFLTLVGMTITLCSPVASVVFIFYLAHEAGWTAILASRKVGEENGHGKTRGAHP